MMHPEKLIKATLLFWKYMGYLMLAEFILWLAFTIITDADMMEATERLTLIIFGMMALNVMCSVIMTDEALEEEGK